MRKLILGIFAVVCVQFAFVIYTALQSPIDLAVGPIFPDIPADRTATELEETPEAPAVDEVEIDAAATEPSRRTETAEKFRADRVVGPVPDRLPDERITIAEIRSRRPDHQIETTRPAEASDFETVVISYNRNPEISDCEKFEAPGEPPQPKKRSYIAKAAPVVKKPWEWIKAIGSKLN